MKYRLKDGINFNLVNKKSIMQFNFNLSDYYNKETRIFEFPKGYVAFSLMSDVFNRFLFPLDLVEKVESDEQMTDKELDNYMKIVNPNFDSHIEKGTIEMSNEYYNLLEEKMARLINENQELKERLERINNYLDKYYSMENQYWFDHIRDIVEDR